MTTIEGIGVATVLIALYAPILGLIYQHGTKITKLETKLCLLLKHFNIKER